MRQGFDASGWASAGALLSASSSCSPDEAQRNPGTSPGFRCAPSTLRAAASHGVCRTGELARHSETAAPARRGGHLFVPQRWHRPKVLKWLRRTHAWIGVWGAVLGLLFGVSGFLLNHRAVMKVPAAQLSEATFALPVPQPPPASATALARWLGTELGIDRPAARVRAEPARPVAWGDKALRQPERWSVNFVTPSFTVSAEHWIGTQHVTVKRGEANFWALLNRLHMGTGMGQDGVGIAWVLLADTIAGGLVLLALTGVLLWTRLHGPRLLALGLMGGATTIALTLIGMAS